MAAKKKNSLGQLAAPNQPLTTAVDTTQVQRKSGGGCRSLFTRLAWMTFGGCALLVVMSIAAGQSANQAASGEDQAQTTMVRSIPTAPSTQTAPLANPESVVEATIGSDQPAAVFATNTPLLVLASPASTPAVSVQGSTPDSVIYYVTNATANGRECPRLDCAIVATFNWGEGLVSIGTQAGDTVSGSTLWYAIRTGTETAYVHSSLIALTLPAVTPLESVSQPALVMSTPVPSGINFICDCTKTCENMVSCEEAYFQLTTCGCSRRDNNDDGIPCEDICLGG